MSDGAKAGDVPQVGNVVSPVASILIDLMDIWGRVIPGVLLLLEVSFWFDPLKLSGLWFGKEVGTPTAPALVLAAVVGIILGEFPVTVVFMIRDGIFRAKRTKVEGYVRRSDPTRPRRIVTFLEQQGLSLVPEDDPRSTFHFCKTGLAVIAPAGYVVLRQMEARLNFQAGLILPALGGCILLLSAQHFVGCAALFVFACFLAYRVMHGSIAEIVTTGFLYYHANGNADREPSRTGPEVGSAGQAPAAAPRTSPPLAR